MQDFFRCAVGQEARAIQQAKRACPMLVMDMIYEAHIQAVVDYNAKHHHKINKTEAREMYLTREQYVEVNVQ